MRPASTDNTVWRRQKAGGARVLQAFDLRKRDRIARADDEEGRPRRDGGGGSHRLGLQVGGERLGQTTCADQKVDTALEPRSKFANHIRLCYRVGDKSPAACSADQICNRDWFVDAKSLDMPVSHNPAKFRDRRCNQSGAKSKCFKLRADISLEPRIHLCEQECSVLNACQGRGRQLTRGRSIHLPRAEIDGKYVRGPDQCCRDVSNRERNERSHPARGERCRAIERTG